MNILARVLYTNLIRTRVPSRPPPRPVLVVVSTPAPRRVPAPIERAQFLPEERSGIRPTLLPHEASGCRALLIEIIRRAAYDWVLYRTSSRLQNKVLAEDAFKWLFVEEVDGPESVDRKRDGKLMTSFVAICEQLDIDPERMRRSIRKMTPKNVMSVGRPAETRRREVRLPVGGQVDDEDGEE